MVKPRKAHEDAFNARVSEYFINLIDNFGVSDPEASAADIVHYLGHNNYAYTPTIPEMKTKLKRHPDLQHIKGTKRPKKYVYRPKDALEERL